MWDEKSVRMMHTINYYQQQQARYQYGYPSAWGFGPHRMAEYLLYGTRRIKHHV